MTQTDSAAESERSPGEIDWLAAERSPEFRELVKKRRGFVIPATVFFLGWYTAFILLAGYAPGFMGESIYQGVTVGYALALTQFLMVWILGGLYLRRADRDFDPLARRAAEKAIEVGGAQRMAAHAPTGHEAGAHGGATHDDAATEAEAHGGTTKEREARHEEAPAGAARHDQAPANREAPPPAPEGAGDGGKAPPGLRSSPTPGAAQSRPTGGERR